MASWISQWSIWCFASLQFSSSAPTTKQPSLSQCLSQAEAEINAYTSLYFPEMSYARLSLRILAALTASCLNFRQLVCPCAYKCVCVSKYNPLPEPLLWRQNKMLDLGESGTDPESQHAKAHSLHDQPETKHIVFHSRPQTFRRKFLRFMMWTLSQRELPTFLFLTSVLFEREMNADGGRRWPCFLKQPGPIQDLGSPLFSRFQRGPATTSSTVYNFSKNFTDSAYYKKQIPGLAYSRWVP